MAKCKSVRDCTKQQIASLSRNLGYPLETRVLTNGTRRLVIPYTDLVVFSATVNQTDWLKLVSHLANFEHNKQEIARLNELAKQEIE